MFLRWNYFTIVHHQKKRKMHYPHLRNTVLEHVHIIDVGRPGIDVVELEEDSFL